MHRSSKEEFLQTRKILDELINRHSRIAAPRAWLGNWYILQVTRGWSRGPQAGGGRGLKRNPRRARPGSVGRAGAGDRRICLLSLVEGPGDRSQALQRGRECQPQPCPRLALSRHGQRVHGGRESGCGRDATRDGALSARSAALLFRVPWRDGGAFRASIRECRKARALVAICSTACISSTWRALTISLVCAGIEWMRRARRSPKCVSSSRN